MAPSEQRRFLAKIPKPKRSIGHMHLASGRSGGFSTFSSYHLDTFCLYLTKTTKRVSAGFFLLVCFFLFPFAGKVPKSCSCSAPLFFSNGYWLFARFNNRLHLYKVNEQFHLHGQCAQFILYYSIFLLDIL